MRFEAAFTVGGVASTGCGEYVGLWTDDFKDAAASAWQIGDSFCAEIDEYVAGADALGWDSEDDCGFVFQRITTAAVWQEAIGAVVPEGMVKLRCHVVIGAEDEGSETFLLGFFGQFAGEFEAVFQTTASGQDVKADGGGSRIIHG